MLHPTQPLLCLTCVSEILQEFFALLLVLVLLLRTGENGGREEEDVHGMDAGRLLFCCCDCWEEGEEEGGEEGGEEGVEEGGEEEREDEGEKEGMREEKDEGGGSEEKSVQQSQWLWIPSIAGML